MAEMLLDRLSLVVGVTGHRDVALEDVPPLRAAFGHVLQRLARMCPHTPLIVGGPQNPACFGGTCGLAFAIARHHGKYVERAVYQFQGGPDGAQPNGLVAGAGGVLYRTTLSGGGSGCYVYGCGTVFRLEPSP